MKLFMSTILSAASLMAVLGSQVAFSHGVTKAKAAELSLHRVERLVTLKKIDASFLTKAESLAIESIPHENEEDPSFRATISQVKVGDGPAKKVEIILDDEGRPLSFKVFPGNEADQVPMWGDRDAVTLLENAHHWIIENVDKEVAPGVKVATYSSDLSLGTLRPGKTEAGTEVADGFFKARASDPTIRVRVNLDGTFNSAVVVQAD